MRQLGVVYGIFVGLGAGCLEPDLVDCGDGRSCPAGTVCELERMTCIDPRGVSVPEGAITFAGVPCDGMQSVMLPLRNFGVSPIDVDASTTLGGISVSPASGQIAPGGVLQLTLTATPATLPGIENEGTLVLTTGYEIVERPLRMTSSGALVTVDATVDFGESLVDDTVSRPLTIVNRGNEAVDVTLALPEPFSASVASPLRIDGATQRSIDLRFEPPAVADYALSGALSYSGRLCQAPAASVALSGIGTGAPILASQTLLDFGGTGCSAPRASRTVMLSSNLADAQSLSSTITGANSSDYSVPFDSGSLLGSGATQTITVTRDAIPSTTALGPKQATLTVTASPGNVSKVIALQHVVSAAVLAASSNQHDFGEILSGGVQSTTVYISNTGDRTGSVKTEIAKSPGKTELIVTPSTFEVNAGDNIPVVIQIKAGEKGELVDARITFTSDGQCSSPPSIAVRATIK